MNSNEPSGYGLALVDGDIVLTNGEVVQQNGVITPVRTFALVQGTENLLQSLTLRVLTPFGSDIFNTTYGLDIQDAFTRANNLRTVKELIKLSLVRTLGTDARVHDIRTILFDDEAEYQARHPELDTNAPILISGRVTRTWRVDVEIDIADAHTQTLSLTIGA